MFSSSPRYTVFLLSFFSAAAFSAQAQTGSGFPMTGIASGQSARVNALNMATLDPNNPTSCSVTLEFLDTTGTVLKQTSIDLQPGAAGSLDLSWDELPGGTLRTEVRAVLLFGYSGGANPPSEILRHTACGNLVPSLEVYDNSSGRTNFILTDAKALPAPAIPLQ